MAGGNGKEMKKGVSWCRVSGSRRSKVGSEPKRTLFLIVQIVWSFNYGGPMLDHATMINLYRPVVPISDLFWATTFAYLCLRRHCGLGEGHGMGHKFVWCCPAD